jgi:Ni2+-binding GTPase involved in maturation of urease and hydrogenase
MLRVQVVGGFLGAGKTTLLRSAARWLAARGERVAVVTNDQGTALVDTSLCQGEAALVEEIAGGCFCCRFARLEEALASAAAAGATVVLAEAVGSCTDLLATVLAPLDARERGRMSLAPLAVVVDPFRLDELSLDEPTDDVAYLYRKQIEEADVVLLSRSDLAPPDRRAVISVLRPGATVLAVSGTTGDGIEAWLGARPTEPASPLVIDYDRYAAAEAALGWFDARVRVVGAAHAPAEFLARFFAAIAEAPIAHVKLTSESPPGAHAALVRRGARPHLSIDALPATIERCDWLLNARIALPPDTLRALLREALADAAAPATAELFDVACFQPARPVPTHRLALRVLHDEASCRPITE